MQFLLKNSKIITYVIGGQTIIQVIGFASGILIVRCLAPNDYALYTLAIAALSTIGALADGGIVMGVVGEGGKVWQDRQKLGEVVASGFHLRNRFALVAMIFCVPMLVYLALVHGAGFWLALLIATLVMGGFYGGMIAGFYSVVVNLHQRIREFQSITIKQALLRTGLVIIALLVLPGVSSILFMTAIAQFYAAGMLRRVASLDCNFSAGPNRIVTQSMLRLVKRSMPDTIYACLSSQITIWVASFIGSTMAIAQIGALGRLAQIWLLVASVNGIVVFPRFARLPEDGRLLAKRYIQILSLLALIGLLGVLVIGFAPKAVLWILGSQYGNLSHAAVLAMANGACGLIAGTAYNFGRARGIVISPWLGIPAQLIVQIAAVYFLNISTLNGILIMGLVTQFFQFVLHATYVLIHFYHIQDPKNDVRVIA